MITCGSCEKRFRAKKQLKGSVPVYYVCGGYIASGRSVCDALGIPAEYLDHAVLDGIQKRLSRVLDPEVLRSRLTEQLQTRQPPPDTIPALEAQLAETRRRASRLVEALLAGPEHLASVRTALVALEREQSRLEQQLCTAKVTTTRDASGDVANVVTALVDALENFQAVLQAGEPEERKAVVRCFLDGIRIEKSKRQAILC